MIIIGYTFNAKREEDLFFEELKKQSTDLKIKLKYCSDPVHITKFSEIFTDCDFVIANASNNTNISLGDTHNSEINYLNSKDIEIYYVHDSTIDTNARNLPNMNIVVHPYDVSNIAEDVEAILLAIKSKLCDKFVGSHRKIAQLTYMNTKNKFMSMFRDPIHRTRMFNALSELRNQYYFSEIKEPRIWPLDDEQVNKYLNQFDNDMDIWSQTIKNGKTLHEAFLEIAITKGFAV